MTIERSDDAVHAFRYGIYNADGSRAGQCGNGLRCVVRWLADRGLVRGQGIRLLGPSGPVRVDVLDDGRIRADMGVPQFDAVQVPLAASIRLSMSVTSVTRGPPSVVRAR